MRYIDYFGRYHFVFKWTVASDGLFGANEIGSWGSAQGDRRTKSPATVDTIGRICFRNLPRDNALHFRLNLHKHDRKQLKRSSLDK